MPGTSKRLTKNLKLLEPKRQGAPGGGKDSGGLRPEHVERAGGGRSPRLPGAPSRSAGAREVLIEADFRDQIDAGAQYILEILLSPPTSRRRRGRWRLPIRRARTIIGPMSKTTLEQLNAFSVYLASRRKAVLQAWRTATDADPAQTSAHALTRGQFNDHVPEVLDSFELQLRSRPGGAASRAAESGQKAEEVKHGLHRWQQGYRLQELMREWGHLHLCLFQELTLFARATPEFEGESLAEANRRLIILVNEAVSESAAQFERMQQAEAAGRLADLESAMSELNKFEQRRSALIHEAVHDLHNNLLGASLAANFMGGSAPPDTERPGAKTLLNQALSGVTTMVNELRELARLEAGKERREISAFDAAALLTELCDINHPIARNQGLHLKTEGPPMLTVEGDSGKVRRLLQNLLLNALKYTREGGVDVSWGNDKANWWLIVEDTGPGLPSASGESMVLGLTEATASARESDEKTAAAQGNASQVLTPKPAAGDSGAIQPQRGEGIGLSIVKRLCELLDASLEMSSSAQAGTTFRVVFPRRYPTAA